jgi:hypothetical protein
MQIEAYSRQYGERTEIGKSRMLTDVVKILNSKNHKLQLDFDRGQLQYIIDLIQENDRDLFFARLHQLIHGPKNQCKHTIEYRTKQVQFI